MIRQTHKIAFVSLVLSIVVASAEIRHIELNGSHLVDTSQNNYALTALALSQQNNWKTVSINGDNVVIMAPNCQMAEKSLKTLSEAEKSLIGNLRNQLANIETLTSNNQQQQDAQSQSYSISRYSVDGNGARFSSGRNIHVSSFQTNGLSINKNDDQNFSIAKPGLPNNLARLFVNNDVVTYVYLDGRVVMKPTACLQQAEQQVLQQLKIEAQQAEEQFKQSMDQFRTNMQTSMQNLQNNLQNMFQPGFPFNNQGGGYLQQQQQPQQQQMMPNMYQQQSAYNGMPYGQNGAGAYANAYASGDNGYNQNQYGGGAQQMMMPSFGANFPWGAQGNPFGQGFPFNQY